ncbi:MAG: protein phosphatase protein [Paenibacillus sp.]|nr:protein phosphatase protein [Paenibacillus sp.]
MKDYWRYATVSEQGTSHLKSGKACQDSSLCVLLKDKNGLDVLVAVVSDGAGSAKCSDQGSQLLCALFVDEMKAYLETGNEVKSLTKEFYYEWLDSFQQEVQIRAEEYGLSPRDYACTFLSAVITENCAVFAQIGDGAIVVASPDDADYLWVFWPQQGEYENTTFFAVDRRSKEIMEFEIRLDGLCDEVAIFTDGLQRMALHYQSQSAYAPFFRPFFKVLRSQEESVSEKYIQSLKLFLQSREVNDRTDDDKTLLLATRRSHS